MGIMSLHHRREVADMRSAYSHGRRTSRTPSSESDYEDHSKNSDAHSTPPTSHSSSPPKRSPLVHNSPRDIEYDSRYQRYFDDRHPQESPRSSVETYASTVQSEEELEEDVPQYDVPEVAPGSYQSNVIAATPSDFSKLFPSRNRLQIRHDDSTIDGNMNLRIDTEVNINHERCEMQLFHLRMHDLKNREFSFRRYCRESGREVCHSTLKVATPKRPGFSRSLSNALNSMRPKSEHRNSTSRSIASLARHDSGYGSMHSMDFDDDERPKSSSGQGSKEADHPPSDTIKLEFSNYAQANVKRTGKNMKRYEFEYWGVHYAWKRVTRKEHDSRQVSYQLMKTGHDRVLAQIVPVTLTNRQAQEERSKGGWIPPCSMWIADEEIIHSQKDLSDVIVAAGLIALVDDSIRARFLSKTQKQLLIPVPKTQMEVEYMGPKRLINEMFNRKEGHDRSAPTGDSRPNTSGAGATRTATGGGRQTNFEY